MGWYAHQPVLIQNHTNVCIGYSTIETKEAARIGYNGFLFPHSYSGDGLGAARIGYNGFLFPHSYSGDGLGAYITGFFFRMSTQVKAEVRSTKTVTWVRMRKRKPVISNTDKFFCFNNNVSNVYNNSVVAKTNGMAYIFTLLMFRKPNKTTINNFLSINVLSILVYI
jgi:hypothetical protein